MAHPLIEDVAEEMAVLLRADRAVLHALAFLIAGVVVALHDRDELHEPDLQFIAEEAVDLQRVVGVGGVYGAEDVEVDLVALQHLAPAHDALKGRLAALVDAVGVVQFTRPVHAEADEEVVLLEELRPVVVEQHSVGLEAVVDAHAGLFVLLLVTDGLAEEVEAHQGRLAALPGEGHFGHLLRLNVLPRVFLQQGRVHAEVAAGVEAFLGEEVTVLAVEVADGAAGLGHEMEGARHRSRLQHGYLVDADGG